MEERRQRGASSSAASRPYPNKRTRSENENASTDVKQASSSTSAQVLEAFAGFRDEIDDYNDRRERLIKSSRDVTSLSKKVIFLLHRFDIKDFASAHPSDKTRKLFSEAETKLDEIVGLLRQASATEGLGSIETEGLDASTKMLRSQRYERNIGGGLEEFVSPFFPFSALSKHRETSLKPDDLFLYSVQQIEAISFYHYLRTTQLISLCQIQDRFRVDPVRESQFYSSQTQPDQATPQPSHTALPSQNQVALHVPTHRYLLGLSDLTGELMRFATNAVGQGDTGAVVKQVLTLTRQLRDGLDPFVPLVRDMKKKQSVTNQSLRKVEDSKYTTDFDSRLFSF